MMPNRVALKDGDLNISNLMKLNIWRKFVAKMLILEILFEVDVQSP